MNLATIKPSTIKQVALTRRALAVVSAVGMAAVALLQAMPASASEADGDPRVKCVEHAPYFFHGVSGLQGGFSTDAPTSPAPATQLALRRPGLVKEASWADSFHGDLCGRATVTVHGTSAPQFGPCCTIPAVSMSANWQVRLIADGDNIIAYRTSESFEAFMPQEVTFTFRSRGGTVAEKLEFWFEPGTGAGGAWGAAAVLYDSPEYAAGFTISTLEPCEENDPHPDCQFADLAGDVRAFASTGEVSADGETQLLAALDQAQTAYGDGAGDNAQAIARLEDFRQLAGDPALVPSEPARDTLTATAGDLIAALEASEPA